MCFFFVKQKTAYEMRISDWSSDVCSSDLFTPSGGTVQVSLVFDGDGAAMAVADNGVGMASQQIPVALEPFGQVDGSLSRSHEGTGLGLPLCQRFAEAHGGRLAIESALGKGTTVTVRLPVGRLLMTQAA